jgi:hypothetical protein
MKPMLMLFLDLTHEDDSATPGTTRPRIGLLAEATVVLLRLCGLGVVGGKSGGLLNELLLEEFRAAAKEHSDRITFVYLNGVQHADQMRSLGRTV